MKTLKSFKHAIKGIIYCLLNERNLRIHTVIALYVMFFSSFFSLSALEYAILFLTFSLVLSAELFNTAIEEISDHLSPKYSQTVRIVKDISAGAVLFCSFFSIIIGLFLFWNLDSFVFIYNHFKDNFLSLLFLILSFFISYLYILKPIIIKKILKVLLKRRK